MKTLILFVFKNIFDIQNWFIKYLLIYSLKSWFLLKVYFERKWIKKKIQYLNAKQSNVDLKIEFNIRLYVVERHANCVCYTELSFATNIFGLKFNAKTRLWNAKTVFTEQRKSHWMGNRFKQNIIYYQKSREEMRKWINSWEKINAKESLILNLKYIFKNMLFVLHIIFVFQLNWKNTKKQFWYIKT